MKTQHDTANAERALLVGVTWKRARRIPGMPAGEQGRDRKQRPNKRSFRTDLHNDSKLEPERSLRLQECACGPSPFDGVQQLCRG